MTLSGPEKSPVVPENFSKLREVALQLRLVPQRQRVIHDDDERFDAGDVT